MGKCEIYIYLYILEVEPRGFVDRLAKSRIECRGRKKARDSG